MIALHSYPHQPKKGDVDLVDKICQDHLHHEKGLSIARVERTSDAVVSIYLHRIQNMISATTHCMNYPDTYAVVIQRGMMAYNIGAFPLDNIFIMDRIYYDTLERENTRFAYLVSRCLHASPPRKFQLHVHDACISRRLEIFDLHDHNRHEFTWT